MDNNDEKSRVDIITHEIECGGFTINELDEILDAVEKAQEILFSGYN